MIAAGCSSDTASSRLVAPAIGAPAQTQSYDISEAVPCDSNQRACGGNFPALHPNPAVITPWGIIHYLDMGVYAKTWTPSGETLNVSLFGSGYWRRGSDTGDFQLACSAVASSCGDLFRTHADCLLYRNEIGATTHHVAAGAVGSAWTGTFSDRKFCFGPSLPEEEVSCDPSQVLGDPEYDPYDEETCDGGDGGAGQGSGTQYYPGDHTGGETVDWSGGTGNGGSSACGADAVVEYICIDTWNESTGQWENWSCGYATTCG